MISGIKAPDTQLAREAEEFVQSSSSAMLYNHVMRCYWFAELFARQENAKADRELMFFSATLHDLGFTEHGRGPHRFEIEGAHAARRFLKDRGVPDTRSWQVWSTIALHTWDINLYKEDEARLVEHGILYDVVGLPDAKLDTKQPYQHFNHICTCIAHNRSPMAMPDGQAVLNGAPFDE